MLRLQWPCGILICFTIPANERNSDFFFRLCKTEDPALSNFRFQSEIIEECGSTFNEGFSSFSFLFYAHFAAEMRCLSWQTFSKKADWPLPQSRILSHAIVGSFRWKRSSSLLPAPANYWKLADCLLVSCYWFHNWLNGVEKANLPFPDDVFRSHLYISVSIFRSPKVTWYVTLLFFFSFFCQSDLR